MNTWIIIIIIIDFQLIIYNKKQFISLLCLFHSFTVMEVQNEDLNSRVLLANPVLDCYSSERELEHTGGN